MLRSEEWQSFWKRPTAVTFPAFKNIFKGVVAGKELCTFQVKSVFGVTDFID